MKALKKEIQAIMKELKTLTKKAEKTAKKVDKLSKVAAPKKAKSKAKAKTKIKAKARATKKKTPAKRATAKVSKRIPASDSVMKLISKSKKGIRTADLMTKTGFKEKKIRDVIYRLKKQGKVKSQRTGLYVKI